MADIDTTRSVAQLVVENPSRARFFDRIGIDYRRSGARSLKEACDEQGLDARTVLVALLAEETSGQEPVPRRDANLKGATPSELIQNIIDLHHAYLYEELPRLEELSAHVKERYWLREPRLAALEQVLRSLRLDLEAHLRVEEEELFPAFLRETGPEDIEDEDPRISRNTLVEIVEQEHEVTGMLLEEIRNLTDGFVVPEWGCDTFKDFFEGLEELERNTRERVDKEINLLLPAVFGP